MSDPRIPNAVAAVVGKVLGAHYYSHTRLNSLFYEKGAPGDPPEGNCEHKCTHWLKRASADRRVDAHAVLGGVLEEFMEVAEPRYSRTHSSLDEARQKVRAILAEYGLSYHRGGQIIGARAGTPTRSLETIVRDRDLSALEVECQRALTTAERDPEASLTAACAIIESLCKIYIGDEKLELPTDKSVKPLWRTVQAHLGLSPAQMTDDDLKRILSGLSSIVDGIGSLRTHAGSAHGRGRRTYRVAPRHARLALHAAHTLAVFVLETWDARKETTDTS